MNYYALFLNEKNFIEKCILLMRFISNPSTKSRPHITVRLFKVSDSRIEESKERRFSYLNIIEPGTFNFQKKEPPYVVFLQCESEELEGIEYKPDFPYSRLHITIYEGDDYVYANKLYQILVSRKWHFKLIFDGPRKLTEQKVGIKNHEKPDFQAIFKEVIGEGYQKFLGNYENNRMIKLELMEKVLQKLDLYLKNNKTEPVESFYSGKLLLRDNSVEKQKYKQMENIFNPFSVKGGPVIPRKPVKDAIFITPPEYARDMVECGLSTLGNDIREIDFGDSAIGTGNLFLALRRWINEKQHYGYRVRSAVGVDIDKRMAEEAYVRYHKRGLKVIYGDALLSDIDLGKKRNLMLVNPPFNRHEQIPSDYRKVIYKIAKEQTGISVAGNAGLYVYHLLIMDKWLCKNAVAVWLLPAIFMQTKYGMAIRTYLLNNVQLIKIHVYNEEIEQFDNTHVSTSIVVFRKGNSEERTRILISYGASMEHPISCKYVQRDMLLKNIDNWRRISNENNLCDVKKNEIIFNDLFEIRRGVATGANSFFVMTREKAMRLKIPDIALKPLIPKARYLKSLVIEDKEDGYPDVDPQLVLIDCDLDETIIQELYPSFYDYLQLAKVKGDNGVAIVDRFLIRNRQLWYKQEKREPPTFLLTYMGRNKENLPPLYFIWNKSQAIALNTYLLLYPRQWLIDKFIKNPKLYEIVLKALNTSAEKIVSTRTRIYSGGLNKIEPNELRKMPVIGLDELLNFDM